MAHWNRRSSPVFVVLSKRESLTPPDSGWEANPWQVSSQEMLVLIYQPQMKGLKAD